MLNSTWTKQRYSDQKQLERHHAELKFSRTTWAHFPPKVLKMSLTRIEKYSERGQILKDPPGRLPRKVHWAPLGVWLGSLGRLCMSRTVRPEVDFFVFLLFFSYLVLLTAGVRSQKTS